MDEWRDGFPVMPGWYLCQIDGEEIRLKHYICQMRNKHEWIDETGEYIRETVRWKGECIAP